jgi:phosphate starvation-inducible membrane PsiE
MGYLISGNLTNPARLIIMDESDLNSVIYSGSIQLVLMKFLLRALCPVKF